MTTERSETWSWREDVLPTVAMLMVTCLDMSMLTIVKAAMNDGLNSYVFVVYHNALGTLILLPFFIVHTFRNVGRRPPLTFRILLRFFILGLLGICLFQGLVYIGLGYSSPTLASAISNLAPGNTFLIAVAFRMEKIDLRISSSRAKLFGTIIAISGAMVFTFYQGPKLFNTVSSSDSHNGLLLPQTSNWVFGGLILVTGGIVGAIWKVLQSATCREYPDQFTVVFFYCFFGTIACAVLFFFLVQDLSAWVLKPGIAMVAIVFGAVFTTVFRSSVVTWCLRKKGPVFVAMFPPLSLVIASIMGLTFLGDSLRLGSVIGGVIVVAGFYSVMLGQIKEKKVAADLVVASLNPTPLLSSENGSNC